MKVAAPGDWCECCRAGSGTGLRPLAAEITALRALPDDGDDLRAFTLTPAPLTGQLDDNDVVDLGERVFDVLHLRGHSPGSIALYGRRTSTLFSGDVIDDGMLLGNAGHSDPDAYTVALHRLKELSVETVHTGHEACFRRERLHAPIASCLAGGQRFGGPQSWVAETVP